MEDIVTENYRIYVSLHSDLNSSDVWISHAPKYKYIRITNNKSNVTVKRRGIDNNFRIRYNKQSNTYDILKSKPSIVLNSHYRKKLNLKKNEITELKIEGVDSLGGLLHTTFSSPNPRDKYIFSFLIAIAVTLTIYLFGKE